MLANLKGIFAPQAVVQSLKTLPPVESTIMDTCFRQRPAGPFQTAHMCSPQYGGKRRSLH